MFRILADVVTPGGGGSKGEYPGGPMADEPNDSSQIIIYVVAMLVLVIAVVGVSVWLVRKQNKVSGKVVGKNKTKITGKNG